MHSAQIEGSCALLPRSHPKGCSHVPRSGAVSVASASRSDTAAREYKRAPGQTLGSPDRCLKKPSRSGRPRSAKVRDEPASTASQVVRASFFAWRCGNDSDLRGGCSCGPRGSGCDHLGTCGNRTGWHEWRVVTIAAITGAGSVPAAAGVAGVASDSRRGPVIAAVAEMAKALNPAQLRVVRAVFTAAQQGARDVEAKI